MNTKIIRTWLMVFAGVALFMPLVVMPASFIFPFIVPKILLFRTMVWGMICCYTLLLSVDFQGYRPRLTWQTGIVGLFFVSFVISTFSGVDWYRSFWDNHERMLGLFTLLHYGAFFLILSSPAVGKREWVLLSRVLLVSGALTMLSGVVQKFFNPLFLLNNEGDRVIATLGNSIYVSGYGLFLWLFGTYHALKEKSQFWRRFSFSVSALGFLGIFLGGTRGTILALLAVLGVACMSLIIQRQSRRLRLIAVGVALCGLVCVGLMVAFRESSVVRAIPGVNRLAETSFADAFSSPRFMSWEIALTSWRDFPVFGWGPNNFYYAFNAYYRPEFLRHGFGETWFDNAHNIVVNTLSTQGVFGLAIYLTLFIVFFVALIREYRAVQTNTARVQTVILLSFLVGHFVHNIFVFENPTSYLYFFFILAYMVHRYGSASVESVLPTRAVSVPVVCCVVLVCGLFVFATNINPARANMATLDLLRDAARGINLQTNYEQVLKYPTPHIDDVRNDIARSLASYVQQTYQSIPPALALELLDQSISDIEKNITLHPVDVRLYLQMSDLYRIREGFIGDGSSLARALTALDRALEISPKRQQILFNKANVYTSLGDVSTATALLLEAKDLDPTVLYSWTYLLALYSRTEDAAGLLSVKEGMEMYNLDIPYELERVLEEKQKE